MAVGEHQSTRTLADCCGTLYKLVLLQTALYVVLAWVEHSWLSLLWLIEPFILFCIVVTLQENKSHGAAIIIFGYLVVLIGLWLVRIFLAISDDVPTSELKELLHPAHHLKEYVEIYIVGAAWRAVVLTRNIPSVPNSTITH